MAGFMRCAAPVPRRKVSERLKGKPRAEGTIAAHIAQKEDSMSEKSALSRRSFLGLGATAALAAGAAGLAGCAPSNPGAADAPAGNGSTEQPEAIGFGGGQGPTSMGYGRIQNPSFLTPPAPLAESDAAEVQEADVVILGAGNAGCAAAASCADHGVTYNFLRTLTAG